MASSLRSGPLSLSSAPRHVDANNASTAPSLTTQQMMAHFWKFDGNSSPPAFVDDEGNVLMKGSPVRIKFFGVRTEIGQMFALGSTKDSYLGFTTNE